MGEDIGNFLDFPVWMTLRICAPLPTTVPLPCKANEHVAWVASRMGKCSRGKIPPVGVDRVDSRSSEMDLDTVLYLDFNLGSG